MASCFKFDLKRPEYQYSCIVCRRHPIKISENRYVGISEILINRFGNNNRKAESRRFFVNLFHRGMHLQRIPEHIPNLLQGIRRFRVPENYPAFGGKVKSCSGNAGIQGLEVFLLGANRHHGGFIAQLTGQFIDQGGEVRRHFSGSFIGYHQKGGQMPGEMFQNIYGDFFRGIEVVHQDHQLLIDLEAVHFQVEHGFFFQREMVQQLLQILGILGKQRCFKNLHL